MLEQLFRWLARVLAGILERYAESDLQAKLDSFNKRVAEVEAEEKEAERQAELSAKALQESLDRRAELDRLLTVSREQETESRVKLAEAQKRIVEIKAETLAAKAKIDSLTDEEKVRLDL